MVNKIPIIKVYREIKKIKQENPLLRNQIAFIGAFETDANAFTPTTVTTIEEAREIYGDDTDIVGNSALEVLLNDNTVNNVIVVNTTSIDNDTPSRTITKTVLENAVNSLDLIDFDLLYVADNLSDTLITVINDFSQERFKNKAPFGYITALTRANNTAYQTTAEKLGDFCLGAIVQRLIIDDTEYSLIDSGAYVTKLISTLNINESLTAKTINDITGLQDIYTFEVGGDGTALTGYGYLLFRLVNATTNTYEAVNSSNPNGLDIYITRVLNAIVNDFALRDFLGELNNTKTLELIKTELNRLYSLYKDLNCVTGMNFTVQKKDSETVEVIINSIQFDGIITEIDVYITIEVI